jgi:hypothetical protein
LRDVFKDRNKQDNNIIINFGNRDLRPAHYSKWIIAASPVFVEFAPWSFSFLTFGQSQSSPYTVPARLLPGICPYHPVLDIDDLSYIASTLSIEFLKSMDADTNTLALFYDFEALKNRKRTEYYQSDGILDHFTGTESFIKIQK